MRVLAHQPGCHWWDLWIFCCFDSTSRRKTSSFCGRAWRMKAYPIMSYSISHSEPIKPQGLRINFGVCWYCCSVLCSDMACCTTLHRSCWAPWAGRPPSRASGPPWSPWWPYDMTPVGQQHRYNMLQQKPRSSAWSLRALETLSHLGDFVAAATWGWANVGLFAADQRIRAMGGRIRAMGGEHGFGFWVFLTWRSFVGTLQASTGFRAGDAYVAATEGTWHGVTRSGLGTHNVVGWGGH